MARKFLTMGLHGDHDAPVPGCSNQRAGVIHSGQAAKQLVQRHWVTRGLGDGILTGMSAPDEQRPAGILALQ